MYREKHEYGDYVRSNTIRENKDREVVLDLLLDKLTTVTTEIERERNEQVTIRMSVDSRLFRNTFDREVLAEEVGRYMRHHFSRLVVLKTGGRR